MRIRDSTADAAAFESSEKARARTLLDSLNEARLSRAIGGAKDNSSPQVSRVLAQKEQTDLKLAAKHYERLTILSAGSNPEQVRAIDQQIKSLTDERDYLDLAIRNLDPLHASLVDPVSKTAKSIQQELDPQTLLLEYSLGERQSYMWVVTSGSVTGFELPPRNQIEALALACTQALIERNREVRNETPQQYRRRVLGADSAYDEAATTLSKMILEPAAALIGNKRLVIVADGALQFISFGALPVPSAAGSAENSQNALRVSRAGPRLLIEDHEIAYEPSASVMALQRSQLENRPAAPNVVAVLANPVFDKNDERVREAMVPTNGRLGAVVKNGGTPPVRTSTQTAVTVSGSLTRALDDVGLNRFPALPFSRNEAEAIIKATGPNRSLAALDFDASRTTAMSPELSKYRIIHFATHAVADFAHPESSGIVLSLINEKAQPQDGYLRLRDIYNLNLPADLVVLSGCQTAVGKQIRGEGLIALTRGFMYAGAKRVVASLWKVDDAATADLMAEFYDQMFTRKLSPSAALRAAQMKLAHQPGRREPYYWAGFVLQGEWR